MHSLFTSEITKKAGTLEIISRRLCLMPEILLFRFASVKYNVFMDLL